MPRLRLAVVTFVLAGGLFWNAAGFAQDAPATQDPPVPKAKAKAKTARRVRRDAPGFYMGRQIADVMSFAGADWLIRETREQEEQPEAMLNALKIPEGATVADVGAGVGYTSVRLSKRVGPKGTVLATDLQPEMIAMLRDNLRTTGVKNVKPLLCTVKDTKLPDGAVDLILMVDVYHESADPETTLKGMRKALKPGGRLVLIEFRGEDPEVPIKPEHKMTVAQAKKEVTPQGFVFKDSIEILPWQHIIIFEKPKDEADPKPKADAEKAKDGGESASGVR
jgi:ubiquinone/menaquinone biosynthesis C-methylase UbiE